MLYNDEYVLHYQENIGYHFTVLDIGGGFPGSAKQIDLFHQVASSINSSIDKLFTNFSDLIIIAEPGLPVVVS